MELVLAARDEVRQSLLGPVEQIEIYEPGYRVLSWREVWERFQETYPGRWAVQAFPPREQLTDGKAVYHLWVLPEGVDPGLNIRVT